MTADSSSNERFCDLAARALENQLTADERAEFDEMLLAHPDRKEEFDQMRRDAPSVKTALMLVRAVNATEGQFSEYGRQRVLEEAKRVLARQPQEKPKNRWWLLIAAAVAVAMAVVVGGLLFTYPVHHAAIPIEIAWVDRAKISNVSLAQQSQEFYQLTNAFPNAVITTITSAQNLTAWLANWQGDAVKLVVEHEGEAKHGWLNNTVRQIKINGRFKGETFGSTVTVQNGDLKSALLEARDFIKARLE